MFSVSRLCVKQILVILKETMNNNIKAFAIEATATYITKALQARSYKPTENVDIIFMYAGAADVESQGLALAKERMRIMVDHVCLIDKYSTGEDVAAADKMKPLCKRVVTGTFHGMTKYFINLPAQKMKHVLCIAVHPQALVMLPGNDLDEMRAIAKAMGIQDNLSDMDVKRMSYDAMYLYKNDLRKHLLNKAKQQVHIEIGTFYRLILSSFNVKEFAFIWRHDKTPLCIYNNQVKNQDYLTLDYEELMNSIKAKDNCMHLSEYKPLKDCPPGKVHNPKTNRCVKDNQAAAKPVAKLDNDCPPGKVRNPKTNRCIKDKAAKPVTKKLDNDCPPGKVRNPKTNRCIKYTKSKPVSRKK